MQIGDKFSRLTAIGSTVVDGKRLFLCECGQSKLIRAAHVIRGATQSCGCLLAESVKRQRNTNTHHLSHTPEYRSWRMMNQRCYEPSLDAYPWYGGKGITVCDRWRNSFETFLSDMGVKPSPRHTIDRIDVTGHYEPSNCRWTDAKSQAINRTSTRWVSFGNSTRNMSEWAKLVGLSTAAIRYRLRHGWSLEDALFTPAGNTGPKKRHAHA